MGHPEPPAKLEVPGSATSTGASTHLWALNRGILLTPSHNVALMSPATTEADVDRHTEVFAEATAAIAAHA